MNAQETHTEELNVTLAESQDLDSQDVETLDVELDCRQPWTKKSFDAYRSKLRLLDKIHNEIADKLNEKREATRKSFFRPEDNYVPESKQNNHLALWFTTERQANAMPSLP